MTHIFKNFRRKYLDKKNIGKYILYALGEIILITLGVLIAVNINNGVVEKKEKLIRCQYLDELNYTFEFDMIDVKGNISGIDRWNPKIIALIDAFENNTWSELDSINDKINAVKDFIFFQQRTKTKMEELKYSSIDLIGNRDLKNSLLLYQDEQIGGLLNIERRYNDVDKEIRKYYSMHLFGNQLNLEGLKKDRQFYSLLRQKEGENSRMKINYELVYKKQLEIKALIELEIEKNCKK